MCASNTIGETKTITSSVSDTDLKLLRQAIKLAPSAREHGNLPFGALLADRDGSVVAEAYSPSKVNGQI
jgi:tRNA(Arg) A34 adenosine deaminase TadA